MSAPGRCAECGAQLENAGSPQEFCPACLLRLGLSGAVAVAPPGDEPEPDPSDPNESGPSESSPDQSGPAPDEAREPEPEPAMRPAPSWGRLARLAALVVVLAILAVLGWIGIGSGSRPAIGTAGELRLSIMTPGTTDPVSFAISPDGSQVVFAAESQLWLRRLDSPSPRPLVGTSNARYPFWSPDGAFIGFFADGMLKRLALGGGGPQTLARAPLGCGGAWSAANLILFAPTCVDGIFGVPATGGEPPGLIAEPEWSSGFPQLLPGDRRFLYLSARPGETGEIRVKDLDSGETTLLLDDVETSAVYSPSGHLFFVRHGVLLAQAFDPDSIELSGDPFLLAEEVAFDRLNHVAALSVARAGHIVYRAGPAAPRRLVWLDPFGAERGQVDIPEDAGGATLSPDGLRIAMHRTVNDNTDLWLFETGRGVASRLTFDPASESLPVWSPDGERVAFRSIRDGDAGLYVKAANGSGSAELLFSGREGVGDIAPTDWSPDGRFLVFQGRDRTPTGWDIWSLPIEGPVEGGNEPTPLVATAFDDVNARFSPDGAWIAYQSNEAGRFEIFLQSFPEPTFRSQLTIEGGTQPVWSSDGTQLFYLASDGSMMTVPVRRDGVALESDVPRPVFLGGLGEMGGAGSGVRYMVAPDGRFLVHTLRGEALPLTIVLNWRGGP